MRISGGSSGVCSSDLQVAAVQLGGQRLEPGAVACGGAVVQADAGAGIGVGGNVVVAGRIARLQVALVAEEAEHDGDAAGVVDAVAPDRVDEGGGMHIERLEVALWLSLEVAVETRTPARKASGPGGHAPL